MKDAKEFKSRGGAVSDPFLIQSFFDAEALPDDLSESQLEAIYQHSLLGTFGELRQVVRDDTQTMLDSVDGDAMWQAIQKEIVLPKQAMVLPARRSRLQRVARFAPLLVGAAMMLASLPGLIQLLTSGEGEADAPAHTVVYVDASDAASLPQGSISYTASHAPVIWYNGREDRPAALSDDPSHRMVNLRRQAAGDREQLTVEEMDRALRHLIQRIETLEDLNHGHIEHGSPLFDTPSSHRL